MRRFAPVLVVLSIVAAGCTGDDDDPDVTPEPTDEPRIQQVASFQVVGTIEKAFAGAEPPIEITGGEVSGASEDATETPVGDEPSTPGVLRLIVEDVNRELTDACGVGTDSQVRIYWTTQTRFDPSDVLDDIEDEITGEVAGISGRVFEAGAGDDEEIFTPEPDETGAPTEEPDLTNASPFAIGSPDVSDNPELSADCVLVADQVGFEDVAPAATQAPVVRRPAAPTATPTQTDEPTAEPDETAEPTDPAETDAPTDEPDETDDPMAFAATATAQQR